MNSDIKSINDLPKDVVKQIDTAFYSDSQIMLLNQKKDNYMKSGRYMEAMNVAKTIEELHNRVYVEYIKEIQDSYEEMSLLKTGVPKEDVHQILIRVTAIMMCVDIMDTCIRDINDILHRTDKTLFFENFDSIAELGKSIKTKMEYMYSKDEIVGNDKLFWADEVDNMIEMIINKSAKILKNKHNKNSVK
jgi:hypothetical protein